MHRCRTWDVSVSGESWGMILVPSSWAHRLASGWRERNGGKTGLTGRPAPSSVGSWRCPAHSERQEAWLLVWAESTWRILGIL